MSPKIKLLPATNKMSLTTLVKLKTILDKEIKYIPDMLSKKVKVQFDKIVKRPSFGIEVNACHPSKGRIKTKLTQKQIGAKTEYGTSLDSNK